MKSKLVVFDFNRTLYDPDERSLMKGSVDVLEKLYKSNIKMILISRKEGNRMDIINKFGLNSYFEDVKIIENKSEYMFKKISNDYQSWEIYVVGDYMHEEIRYGNLSGMETIWIKAGKFENMMPRDKYDKPNYIVKNISEILPIIE